MTGRVPSPLDDFTEADSAESVEWAEAGLPLFNEAVAGRTPSSTTSEEGVR